MKITLEIPDAKLEAVKRGLLFLHPVPEDENNEPTMTEGAWLKTWLKRYVRREVARGLQAKAQSKIGFEIDEESVI